MRGIRTTESTGRGQSCDCRTIVLEEKDVGSTEDTERWKHEQSGLWTYVGPSVIAIPRSNKKLVRTS